jgi:hypothetical protein
VNEKGKMKIIISAYVPLEHTWLASLSVVSVAWLPLSLPPCACHDPLDLPLSSGKLVVLGEKSRQKPGALAFPCSVMQCLSALQYYL